jgi:hypothetical protein
MQFIEPGAFLPHGAKFDWLTARHTDLPDDLSFTIRKQGKEPADIEVKQGEQTWNVKENDLKPLPDDVRKHVEGFLGHSLARFNIVAPPGFVDAPHPPRPPHEGPRGPGDDEVPRVRRRSEGPGGPDGPPPPGGPGGPGRPDGPPRGDRSFDGPPGGDVPQPRERFSERLEQRLEEMTRRMEEMHEQLDALRRHLREEGGERPRRPERPDRPGRPDGPDRPGGPDRPAPPEERPDGDDA